MVRKLTSKGVWQISFKMRKEGHLTVIMTNLLRQLGYKKKKNLLLFNGHFLTHKTAIVYNIQFSW